MNHPLDMTLREFLKIQLDAEAVVSGLQVTVSNGSSAWFYVTVDPNHAKRFTDIITANTKMVARIEGGGKPETN